MKILAIGDFHGRFPEKLKKLAESKEIDLIISLGDFFPWTLKELFFKCCYKKNIGLEEIVGKKKYKRIFLKDLNEGDKEVLSKLGKINKQIFTTVGNYDSSSVNDQYPETSFKKRDWEQKDFLSPLLKKYKNIKRIDYFYAKFNDFVFIGSYGHSSPGKVKTKAYKKHKKILDKLFKKFSKENKQRRVIFIGHNMPYNTYLDKIRFKGADPAAYGKHYGSKLIRRTIDKFQPVLFIGGHMHENQGKTKIGKTIAINAGPAHDSKAAIIELNDKNKKVKSIRFL